MSAPGLSPLWGAHTVPSKDTGKESSWITDLPSLPALEVDFLIAVVKAATGKRVKVTCPAELSIIVCPDIQDSSCSQLFSSFKPSDILE